MKYKKIIQELCHKETDLSQEDIDYLVEQAQRLLDNALYEDEDVFIDVESSYSQEAVVVFHKPPKNKASLYQNQIVGQHAYQKNEPGVLRTLRTGAITIGLSALSQEGVSIQQRVYPISREKGNVIGVVIVETDVTKELDAHFTKKDKKDVYTITNALSELEQITVSQYIQDAILLFNEHGILKQHNPSATLYYTEKFGYMDNLLGLHYDNLALDSYSFEEIKALFESNEWAEEQVVEVKYGHHFFQLKRAYVEKFKTLVMIFKDITDTKKHEQELVSKSVALREMNHRIKNNLQTVMSLLRLQARRSNDTVKALLMDSISRIFAISATHELLSKETNDRVNVFKVIEAVIENIKRICVEQSDVDVILDVDSGIYLDSNRAVAMSLIVNELVQNSFNHAFVKNEGKVDKKQRIHLQIFEKNGLMFMKASDNGKGYSREVVTSDHLGLKIVEEFVKTKLLGKIKVRSDEKGTLTTVSFKI
ncbi:MULTISPECIES: sensor histidine kinase [unclassified Granulicatella]|uniref:sensor histidine kinase n=1 Tax=unclassified Granulicatella TaxID=2630493 RepID=UPI00142FBD37|nr:MULTISPECIES: sensor histidine kinase [unclassified Granulicatella]MBF0780117.1 sensor histidine kinase [Granulicatella sp. 19428wC4_WM01]